MPDVMTRQQHSRLRHGGNDFLTSAHSKHNVCATGFKKNVFGLAQLFSNAQRYALSQVMDLTASSRGMHL